MKHRFMRILLLNWGILGDFAVDGGCISAYNEVLEVRMPIQSQADLQKMESCLHE